VVSDYESAQRRRDVIVGIFVIVGLAALGWMIFKFGDLPTAVSRMRSFQVFVRFPRAPGVQKDTPVRFCGYQIGRVTFVMQPRAMQDLHSGQVYHQTKCVLSINKQYTDIPSNVEVKLMTRGLGSSYIELQVDPNDLPAPPRDPNRPETRFLSQGMELQGSTGMTSEFFPEESQRKLTNLVDDIRRFLANANEIIGDPNNRGNIKTTLANLSDASGGMATAMDTATETMKDVRVALADAQKTLEEYRKLAATGTETLKSADAKAERLVASMVNTSSEIGKAISQLRVAMVKVNEGDGTAGRLINDGRLYENLLESTNQLNVLLKDFKELIDKISEKGLRSVY
jgi:phospholipid/cholesterol/gamma-HCH transport system substrate-binding protein